MPSGCDVFKSKAEITDGFIVYNYNIYIHTLFYVNRMMDVLYLHEFRRIYIYISTFIERCLLVGVSIQNCLNSGNCGNLFRYRYWPRQPSPKQLYSQNRRISQEGRDECHSNRWKLWSHLPCCLNSQLHPELKLHGDSGCNPETTHST